MELELSSPFADGHTAQLQAGPQQLLAKVQTQFYFLNHRVGLTRTRKTIKGPEQTPHFFILPFAQEPKSAGKPDYRKFPGGTESLFC